MSAVLTPSVSEEETYQLCLQQFAQDTRVAFAAAFAGLPSMVEWLDYWGLPKQVKSQVTKDAILDELVEAESQSILFAVLSCSECPWVDALKKTLAANYIKRHGPGVAEVRSSQ